ncbi:uncharacterized protein LOC142235322 [Haematobia irritans]|uniref:uncharacterized protein LOC142235322 n=1 Tax=Haematobia irritans TaxID=7368 RepID=UPI003F5018BB
MSNVETLRNKRTHMKGTATRLENFITTANDKTTLFEVRARLEKLDALYESYLVLDNEMLLQSAAFPERESELVEFETRYFAMKATYCEFIDSRLQPSNPIGDPLNSTTMQQDAFNKLVQSQTALLERLSALQSQPQPSAHTTLSHTANTTSQPVDVRLPKINVPFFDGKYSEFKSFFDLFNSCIHNNQSLTAAQKFQYLKGLLKDDPAALIRHLQVSEQSYEEALQKLKERYDKPSLVVDSLIETFMSIPKAENSQTLRNVSNIADEVIRGLRSQGTDAEKRDPWLIYLLCKKVDRETLHAWAEHSGQSSFPSLESFINFINQRCDALERLPTSEIETRSKLSNRGKPSRAYTSTMKKVCAACPESHHISYCPIFNKLDVPQRSELAKTKLLCFNCLKPNHRVQNCQSKHVCNSCRGHHHTLLHPERKHSPKPNNSTSNNDKPNMVITDDNGSTATASVTGRSVNLTVSSEVRHFNTLLPTAKVLAKDNIGFYQNCYILLDSGCQNTLISEKCVQRLGLSRKPSKIFVGGLGNNHAGATKGIVDLQLKSPHSNECMYIRAHIFNCLTTKLPSTPININYWEDIKNLPLANDDFNTPKDIDILIGFEYFFSLIRDGQIIKGNNLLAQNTAFGWVICSGCVMDAPTLMCHLMRQSTQEDDLNSTLRMFWESESIKPKYSSLTLDDQRAEDLYATTTTKSTHYAVKLPFTSKIDVGESYNAALRRLRAMERKFETNLNFKVSYCEFMREYISMGHMQLIPDEEINRPNSEMFYLPHHAVIRDTSITTKLRVVFDGSSKSSNGKSLNDNLLKGPNLQQDLMALVLRYRCKRFCFSADIKQMYRMIQVQECDRDYQRVLWRESPKNKIMHYRLTTVTYGTTSAPFLALRTLVQLAKDEGENYPLAREALLSCFYVDDCMAGANTIEDAQRLVSELNLLLRAGGFQLRKWSSNDHRVLINVPDNDKIESMVTLPAAITVCLLGVIWDPRLDCFSYKVKATEFHINTKRKMLSEISKIYDPLGWISPVVIAVKIIIQRLWLLTVDWDEELPDQIVNQANQHFSEFHLLNSIRIPRIIFTTEKDVAYHGFCDASNDAYAAVIYCLKKSNSGKVSSNIVMAKTKVAPLSAQSIPRLELCAANLLAEMFEYLIPILSINKFNIVCWSDSKTVLAWLSSHPSRWKVYVSHRTGYILETLPEVKWRYVPTKLNPADCASRGVKSSIFLQSQLWFQGPPFLLQNESEWPGSVLFETNEEKRDEMRVNIAQNREENIVSRINERVSNWPRMIRVLAYCIRACAIFRGEIKNNQPLRVEELKDAETQILVFYQNMEFREIIKNSKSNIPINSKTLRKLSPFVDDRGLLRVGGRLTNANLPYDSQHQIILHKNMPITRKIMRDCHLKNIHAGVSLLIATIRQRYWIIGARELAKNIYYNCGVCHRFSAKANSQLMGDLPTYRVNANHPFYEVGCDYAGPILYKQHNGRKAPMVKAYIAVFMCLVTKAVHLELVTDLSSEAFLAALDRFVARRGLCGHIHTDNATNFQGAAKKLGELYKVVSNYKFNTNISNFLSSKGVQWHFIPPSAPHFGGAWESTVKSVKFHLKRTFGQATLNYEELSTLLARIEAILNSRPLVQADSDDEPYITPGHFLIGRPLNALPETDVTQLKTSTLTKWRLVQQLTQQFWIRWAKDYLLSLQPKGKWLNETPNINVNDIVLLREDNIPPACWKLGRVIETHAGSDGLVRVATIKTENSIFRRPITKLSVLPKDD